MPIYDSTDDLLAIVGAWRNSHESIVMTSGVFDLLHRGHMETLSKMRMLGDHLIVAVNSDESVRRKKGDKRPINPLADRTYALSQLSSIDAVVSFDEAGDQPLSLVEKVQPNIFVKAKAEWNEDSFAIFKKIVGEYGGRTELIDSLSGYSTSDVIKRILMRYQ